MTTDILIRFLGAGLIDVGGDDAKLDRLKQTAADLAEALMQTPSKAASFALIAFDPDAPPDDPVVKEASEALQKRWTTYVNTFSGTPVAVIRAILLDAFAQAAADDDRIGIAFVNSAGNALPFMEGGTERGIWADIVLEIERRVDVRAEAEWATPESISVTAMTFSSPEAISPSLSLSGIDKATFAKKFEGTVGPTNAAGQPTGGNPHWPQSNQAWVTEFGTRMATAFAEAFTAAASGSKIAPIDLSGPLTGFSQSVSAYVEGAVKAVSGATAGLQRRTHLLWWKEALYSPSGRLSYRAAPPSTAAALMAFDLYNQVPTYSPASVTAFLHETVLSLPGIRRDEARPIRDLVGEAIGSEELAPLRATAAQLVPPPSGRGPTLGLLGHGSGQSPLDDGKFRAQIGVPASTLLTYAEWASWLFRELQAARASKEGAKATIRGSKPQ
jgi:hypothetical protein